MEAGTGLGRASGEAFSGGALANSPTAQNKSLTRAIAACKAVKIGAAKGSRAAAADTASALASAQAETAAAKEALVADELAAAPR